MKLQSLIEVLEEWAPPALAESFDNVGLLVGEAQKDINGVLVTLDCLESVVEEAIAQKINCIVTFHPIIFKGLKSLTGKNYVEKAVIKAIKNDISIYAMHTNLDAIPTGVNSKMIEALQLQNPTVLIPKENSLHKLITYVPEEAVDHVLNALYEAGAGQIGNYTHCSFQTEGIGTFTPNEYAQPTKGKQNEPYADSEIKIEVLVHNYSIAQTMKALQKAHPYEEVAYELYPLSNTNQNQGMGMIGEWQEPISEEAFLKRVKQAFHTPCIRHSAVIGKPIQKVAVLGGSGSFAIAAAIHQKADAFISADFKYHDFFQAENKIVLADIGHFESEQFTKNLIFEYITKKFPNFAVQISKVNTNPIDYYS